MQYRTFIALLHTQTTLKYLYIVIDLQRSLTSFIATLTMMQAALDLSGGSGGGVPPQETLLTPLPH